jgi:hypothetical protein
VLFVGFPTEAGRAGTITGGLKVKKAVRFVAAFF